MKKSELRKLINEIVQRKLSEGIHLSKEEVADSVNRLINYHGSPNSVEVLTHHGSYPLKVIEVYYHNGTLQFSVEANPPEELNEADDAETIKQKTAQKNLEAAKKKEEDALRRKRELDKRRADFERRNSPTTNRNRILSTNADIAVGKASSKVADAEAGLAKKQSIQDKG